MARPASARATRSARNSGPARPLAEHLTAAAFAVGISTALVLAVIAALATSRATGHTLSPAAVIAVVIGVAITLATTGWANGLYGGADDVLADRTVLTCAPGCASEPEVDPFQPRSLWRSAAISAGVAGLWAGATAGFVAVVLDAERAPFLVVGATLIGTVALAVTVIDIAARHRGAHAARAFTGRPATVTLRRRAWREIALPLGATQLVVNGAASWMLFHDYNDIEGPRALTSAVVTADLPVIAIIAAAYFGTMATRWGRIESALGRVAADDPTTQAIDRRMPIGPQALVYVVVAAILFGNVVAFFVPSQPSLLVAALARGVFAAIATTVAAGMGFVRGAVNGTPARQAEPPTAGFSLADEHGSVYA